VVTDVMVTGWLVVCLVLVLLVVTDVMVTGWLVVCLVLVGGYWW